MFELQGSKVERGVFEYQFTKPVPFFLKWAVAIGPIWGRFLVLGILLGTAYLAMRREPLFWIMAQGYNALEAARIRELFINALLLVAIVVFFSVRLFRQEKLSLTFDRPKGLFRMRREGWFTPRPAEESVLSLKALTRIETHRNPNPVAEPKRPKDFGYIEIGWEDQNKAKAVRVRVLSEEQFKIIPTNLETLSGVEKTSV